jgi:lysophospholipase L1-like esterase
MTAMKTLLLKCALSVSSLCLLFAGGELALRISGAPPITATVLSTFFHHDPVTGWSGVADANCRFATTDFDVQISHDAAGLRRCGLDWPIDQDAVFDGRVVWVLGDSYTWGWGVEDGQTFVARLNQAREPDEAYRNLGVVGFGSVQQYLQLRERFQQGHCPDEVLLVFSANDVRDNVTGNRNPPRPYFEVRGGRALLRNSPAPASPRWQVKSWLKKNSLAYNYLYYVLRRAQTAGSSATTRPRRSSRLDKTEHQRGELALREAYRRIRDLCGDHGVRFTVATEHAAAASRSVRQVCRELDIPLLDLSKPWSEHLATSADPLQFSHDPHYTARGHQLLAHSLRAAFSQPVVASRSPDVRH